MTARITFAGEKLIAAKLGQKKPLIISKFIYANVPGLDPVTPVDRAAGLPPADQIVYAYDIPAENAGYVNPNQVVYSSQLGSDIGDFDFNYLGLIDADGVLFAVTHVPLQQKRKNIAPHQLGNNITRNFLIAYDGAQELTGITIDASTWQHDFTIRLAGIDERERLSNYDMFGRACFFGGSLQVEKADGLYRLKRGTAYVQGIRIGRPTLLPITPPALPTTVWLDVALQRELNDVVANWQVVFGADRTDYTDSTGIRHYCIALADLPDVKTITDRRSVEHILKPMVQHFAARDGDYPGLRARATTKADVELDQIPNAISDDPETNSSQILATTAALNNLKRQVGDSMTGMVAPFAMPGAPEGWLKCNGAAISRKAFALLFGRIGTLYGAGDGVTTFGLPDLRGEFIRGWDDGRGKDEGRTLGSSQNGQNASHIHTAESMMAGGHMHTATIFLSGSHTHMGRTGSAGRHTHDLQMGYTNLDQGRFGGGTGYYGVQNTLEAGDHTHDLSLNQAGNHNHEALIARAGDHSHLTRINASGGNESRPGNFSLLLCIKY